VEQLWRASLMLVTMLEETFLPGEALNRRASPDGEMPDPDRWRHRYSSSLERLRHAGVETVADGQAGAEEYGALRSRWDRLVTPLASAMAYGMDEIDPAGRCPLPTEGDKGGTRRGSTH
jgi:hypothetical protein